MCFFIPGLFCLYLFEEPPLLVKRVVQFRERICDLTCADKEFKPFYQRRVVRFSLCKRGEFNWVIDNEDRLDKTGLHLLFEYFIEDLAER